MAVQNKYVDAQIVANRTAGALSAQGIKTVDHVATFEIAAADDDASVFRIIKSVPSAMVPVSLRVSCDALTGCTDVDVGLYLPDLGAVVEVDILADGINMAAGFSRILALDGLVSVDLADCKKSLWELAGKTVRNKEAFYDVAMTFNTIGSGAGTVMVVSTWANP